MMKLTQARKVWEIVLPPGEGLSLTPAVAMSDSVTRAVEMMLENDRTLIAVIAAGRLIGQVRLSDALAVLGLQTTGDGGRA